ncbi:MAG TPA: CvpA family protein [Chthoniobacterales bacterium]
MSAPSSGWQLAFVSFAAVLVLFEIVRGWRRGVVRQLVRLLALVVAYASALFGGRALLPVLRPMILLPDFIISAFSGLLLGLVVYALINTLGAILFKRTAQQPAGMIRFLYGFCGGVLGIFFGLFSVWLMVVAIRSLGAIAGAESKTKIARRPPALDSLHQLKSSIEQGSLGKTVKIADVVPTRTYDTLGKLGDVVSNPRSAERFLHYPGARELTENPRLVALRNDPEIIELIEQQRYLDLLQNPKLINALNDPSLVAQVKSFDFEKALDYALAKQ